MKHADFMGIVPEQHIGKEIEAESSIEFDDENHANIFYKEARQRLLNVNEWHFLAGVVSAHFKLLDNAAKEVERSVQEGDYIRIDIPGPGSTKGDGYDWVCVEELKENSGRDIKSVGFRVRPSENPFNNKNEVAHFYSAESTSSFIVMCELKKVTALVIDRNISPNNDQISLTDKIRHVSVGIGAMGLFSKVQWKNLTEGIVRKTRY